jgi:dyslexia susceptibility 1 candidate gene 1 protein
MFTVSFVYSGNSCFVNFNFPPYYFELDLWGEIDDEKSVVTVGNDQIVFQLFKQDPGIWPDIDYKGKDRLERRRHAEERAAALEAKVYCS